MDSYGRVWTEWKQERVKIYTWLDKLANDLHSFHKESSQYVCGGTVARAGGTFLHVFGVITLGPVLAIIGSGLQVVGGATVCVTQLLQERADYMALHTAAKMLDTHKATHNLLKSMVAEMNLTLPSLDYQLQYTPDMRTLDSITDMVAKSAMLAAKFVKSEKGKIIMSTLSKVTCVINAIEEIVKRDAPLFVRSWETMNGSRVPETVSRLRILKNDLERHEDDLKMQFNELFCSKEFRTTLKKINCW